MDSRIHTNLTAQINNILDAHAAIGQDKVALSKIIFDKSYNAAHLKTDGHFGELVVQLGFTLEVIDHPAGKRRFVSRPKAVPMVEAAAQTAAATVTVKDNALELFTNRIGHEVVMARKQIEKFQVELMADPAHAFKWADTMFTNAAIISVNELILGDLGREANKDITIQKVARMLNKRALELARASGKSSSSSSVIMEREIAIQWAKLADSLADD